MNSERPRGAGHCLGRSEACRQSAAIIVFTMAVRAVLVPLSFRAMRGQAVQARLAPALQALAAS